MQRFNKAVALLLCMVMLVGLVPVSTLAAEGADGTVVDAAIIFSDLHTSENDYKESTLKGILTGIKNAGVTPSSVTSAGDAFSVNYSQQAYDGYTSTLTGYIRDVFPGVAVNYVWSDHDRYALQEDDSTLLSNDSGFVYGAGEDGLYGTEDDGNYYIYSLSMADLSTNNRYNADFHTDAEVTQAIADFTAAAADLDQTKPLFIASHQPLLDRRNDNGHAYEWATAINAVAEKMDVAFFFGHNHSYDVAEDYYCAKGETMSVCSDSSGNAQDVVLNFTHMCAGYMAPSSTGSTSNTTRQGVAVGITIYDDAINYITYDVNGVYTGSYALNETVTRAFAEAEPETPENAAPDNSVPETTESDPADTDTSEPGIDEELSNSVTIGGTTYEEKIVYVRANSLTNGGKYLIVNPAKTQILTQNSGYDGTAAVTVTSGTVTVNGTTYNEYIADPVSTAVWTAATNGSGFNLTNGGQYLVPRESSDMVSANAGSAWTYDGAKNRLSGSVNSGWYSATYYVNYNGSEWVNTTNASSVYLYQQVTAQVPTNGNVTYTMQADNLDVILSESGTTTGQLSYALLGNGVETALPSGGSYKLEVVNDTADIISTVTDDGTVTFSGNEGTCYVKVSYTWGEYTVYKYATVTARKPFYKLEITAEADGSVITDTQTAKGDVAGTTRDYSAKLLRNGTTEADIDLSKVVWTSSNETIATVDANGVVTFTGAEGTVQITATYEYVDAILTDTINIYVTEDLYIHPTDGTNDFPEYPNEGAIRFDKTAEAVGTFSETGVAKLELSMTGVPYTTDNRMDVVLMLDRSSSMYKSGVQHRISSTIAATRVFIENIVKNEDGSFNNNRILVLDFLGGNLDSSEGGGANHKFVSNQYTQSEEDGYEIISSQAELEALFNRIDEGFVGQTSLYGTEYAQGLELCYNALAESRDDGNKQFCVFMSDGIPNYMKGETTHFKKTDDIVARFDVTNRTAANGTATRGSNYEYEYYSTRMKNEGVTVYTVGLGLKNTNSAWSGTSKEVCEQVANMLLNDIAGPAYEKNEDRDTGNAVSKLNEYFFSISDDEAAENMDDVFGSIAQKILEAATNVVVTDKINDEYTMVFGIPQSQYTDKSEKVSAALENEEFYIEFVEYALNANHERTTSTSKLKLYLGVTDNTYYAATAYNSTNDANKFADPIFTAKTGDAKAYWSVVDSGYTAQAGEIVIKVGSATYKFIENGSGTHNMTSGAYAYGTIDSTTKMSGDLVIVTPYFAYCAKTRMLAWTVEKLTTVEYALNYFLYLDNSAADIGENTETDEGPYPTNDYAYITYTNFNGNDCRQEFPIPQLTWNGAQVSYVFYLVNGDGQPINKSGQVVDFANATFITDVFTKHIIWNDPDTPVTGADSEKEGVAHLDANYEAIELLPSDYTLYDNDAYYELVVYEDHEGNVLKNYFKIDGSEVNGSVSSTTKVYNTKAGIKYSAYKTYYAEDVANTFDFGNTTVAFAVVWQPKLVPDVVVVDYGLDVLIDVVRNDLLQNTVHGIGKEKGSSAINSGISTSQKYESAPLTINGNTITIEDENRIRFHQGDMEFKDAVTFYYDSAVSFYEQSTEKNGYLYSSVTVIPATTIYYEDSFVDFRAVDPNTWELTDAAAWITEGTTINATQSQDRPGDLAILGNDANNLYGYDGAYDNCSMYSLGSARKLNVSPAVSGEMIFTFYGTGFDVISMTSNTTGAIVVDLYDPAQFWADDGTITYEGLLGKGDTIYGGTIPHDSLMVDTYYGYTYKEVTVENEDGTTTTEKQWVPVDTNDPNALYQVPVIKVENLPYGKYTAVITAGYNSIFDHANAGSYDFYLDAIRIYDPANDGAGSSVIQNAYTADGEGWPAYTELREMLISAGDFNDAAANEKEVPGIIFIDGDADLGTGGTVTGDVIGDYVNFGPNNELYLAPGQAVAFKLSAGNWKADATGVTTLDTSNIAKVQIGLKSVGLGADDGTDATVRIYDASIALKDVKDPMTISTATDMYYDITDLNGKVVVIHNDAASETILSITNLKVTFKAEPEDELALEDMMANVVTVDDPAAQLAVASIFLEEEDTEPEPEETLPEETVPEETEPAVFDPDVFYVTFNKSSVKVGQKVKVTVVTSREVNCVTVNGQVITTYSESSWSGIRTWSMILTANTAESMIIDTVAYDAEGTASEAISRKITVRSSSNWWDWLW